MEIRHYFRENDLATRVRDRINRQESKSGFKCRKFFLNADIHGRLFRLSCSSIYATILKAESYDAFPRLHTTHLFKMEEKPTILHLGDPIKYNLELHQQLQSKFTIVQPTPEERRRPAFLQALRDQKWGPIVAIYRPFFSSGGEMGRFDSELIPLLPPSLKVFASAGAGYDWADIDVLAEHGILYCNGAGAPAEAVADMAIWHMLSCFRNLTWSSLAARSLDAGQFRKAHKFVPETSRNPRGCVLGIVGMGTIGFKLAVKARLAFGMEIAYYDVVRKSKEQEKQVEARFYESIEELVAAADCVVLVIPFAGRQLVNKELISKFKKGSSFVNVARGQLVDEEALADALESGHLAAAGLDVHADEPHVNERLASMRNVTLTSHNGGGAVETRIEFERLSMENVLRVLSDKEPLTPVNLHMMKMRN